MDVAGLVSSIITFIDFSWTIVRGTYDIHSSTAGATEENVHIGNVLQDLQVVTEKMRREMHGQNDHEKALLELEYMCRGLSSDLAAILQKLTAKRRSGLQSLNIMLRSLIKEKKVREIESRLGEYRGQIILRLNLILLYDLHQRCDLSSAKQHREKSVAMQNSFQQPQDLESTLLRNLKEKAMALNSNDSVLRHLYFDEMYNRADDITDATHGTFDWLLRDDNTCSETNEPAKYLGDKVPGAFKQRYEERRQMNAAKISDFLEHGGGVFFLRGKPGSGKSTLMKYLNRGRGKREVDRRLRKWAGQKKLVRVFTVFLLHGTPLQRSLEGFYRTFFFELLRQCPGFTDILFPKQLTHALSEDSFRSSFRLKALQEAWERLVSFKQHEALSICVSIDGMDELEGNSGDRLKFARILNEWAQSGDVKIICSGRPNAELNIVFNQPHQTIDLQDLTEPDIRKILMERFERVRKFSDLTEDNIEELVDNISGQSEGVILWAVLVGKNLEDDIIHAKSLRALKQTIQTLPSGIEDLFNEMWQDLREDAHRQLMLRAIYDLLTLHNGEYSLDAIRLSWLEDALFDDEFPYNQTIQVLPVDELKARLAKVRSQLVHYTKHFVEIITFNPERYHILHHCCRFIHRSAQEFIQSNLELIGTIPAPRDYTFYLDLRLSLMLLMSIEASPPTYYFGRIFTRLFYATRLQPHPRGPIHQIPIHQIQYKLMEKLREVMEFRRGLLSGDSATDGSVDECWRRLELGRYSNISRSNERDSQCVRRKTFTFFNLAVDNHQIDYVNRTFNDRIQPLGREELCLGLLTCVAGPRPKYELFELLVDHGADLDSLVNVYGSDRDEAHESVPLWLLFCFTLAFKVSTKHVDVAGNHLKTDLSDEFFILERFLCLGYGSNVRFLAAPSRSDFGTDGNNLFGMDLIQLVRLGKPRNMSRLLLFLQPVPVTFSLLVQRVVDCVLQPQFPFHTLPQGADTMPYRTLSDEYLRREGWEVQVAFEGEYEVRRGGYYYIPGW